MSHEIDRRRFLEVLTAGAAGSAIGAMTGCGDGARAQADETGMPVAASAPAADHRSGRGAGHGENVIVLGAGLAGLTAAYVLMNEGYDVTVLEGQHRVGGRVLTVREGLQDGFHAEMGAVRIFDTHAFTNKYVGHFGLPLVPYDDGRRAFHLRGRRFPEPAKGEPWPIADMTDEERLDPDALLPRYVLAGFDQVGDFNDPRWPNAFDSALALDRVTVEQFMRDQGASSGWIDWFRAREGNIKRMNACAAFATEAASAGGESVTSIEGGNDRLPKAFAAALGERVLLDAKVVRIAQDAEYVKVGFQQAGRQHQISARHCICALPFSTLRDVAIATPFSDDKMAAIHGIRYMASARGHFQTRTRFWERDQGQGDSPGSLGGLNLVNTDTYAGRIWNTSSQQAGSSGGLIHAYMFDVEALEYASHGRGRLHELGRFIGRELLPGLEGEIVASVEKVWQEDPWVRGAWVWAQPGEMARMYQAMRRAEGRVHFAGEHTSAFIAYMNGAIESGERAAAEVLHASGCAVEAADEATASAALSC